MTTQALYQDIKTYCETNADQDLVQKYARFFKEGYDAYGLSDKLLQAKIDAILANPETSFDLIKKTSIPLVASGKYEETYFAILLMKEFADKFDLSVFDLVSHWFEIGINNWAHCDVFCRDITTVMLDRNVVNLQTFDSWRYSQNKYQRRAVPVSMISLLDKQNDYQPMFEFIEPLMMDSEKTVQQGIGWFLREAWKIHKKSTETFLLQWKNEAPRVIYQYATEKMSKEERLKFRKEKC
jgi:3-methyladenine DNA glycosylase AlkD